MPPLLAEIDWNTLLADRELVLICAVWVILAIVVLAAIVAVQWRKAYQTKCEALLKQQMLERGFTADDIAKVIDVGVSGRRARKPARAGDEAHKAEGLTRPDTG